MSILEVKNVSIRYLTGDFKNIGLKEYVIRKIKHNYHVQEFWADRHVSFTLEKGDMLGIIGTNGAGKSTLLKAVTGIMEPTEGKVVRNGKVSALLELASGFDGDLTVKENTYLRGAMLGYTRKYMDEMYDYIIDFAELKDFQDRPFKQLSSGMRSRLAFSIASLVNPDILILDEVLSVGDGAFRKKSEKKMREIIGSGATTILVSHSLPQVREMCNKVLWLHKGEQIAFGDTKILCNLYEQFLENKLTIPQVKQIWAQLNDKYDYLVVGSGLSGATFARRAADAGKKCLVIDRRPQLGGNVYCRNMNGIDVHMYGAHIFHTDNEKVWSFVTKYAKFSNYVHRGKAKNGDKMYSMPFNMHTFKEMWNVKDADEAQLKINSQKQGITEPKNLEEQAISLVGTDVYNTLVKHYTEKQWGRSCRELPASIIKRLPLRFEFDDRYFTDPHQGIPEAGYNSLINNLLKGIPSIVKLDYKTLIATFPDIADKIVYTGSIDGFFDYSMGHLEYRGLKFDIDDLPLEDFQGHSVVNYCDAKTQYTRIIEHKHFTGAKTNHTVITREYPEDWTPGKEAYYPVNTARNENLYKQYKEKAAAECPNVIFAGRLGAYRYYDMDDAIAASLELADAELK